MGWGLEGPSPPPPTSLALPVPPFPRTFPPEPGRKAEKTALVLRHLGKSGCSFLESPGMLLAPLGSHGSDGSFRPLPGSGTQVGRSLGLGHWEQENGLDRD